MSCGKEEGPSLYLDPMANVIQAAKVEGFPVVGREGREAVRGDDFLARGQPLDGGQGADLPPGHLLQVHIHHLPRQGWRGQWASLCTVPFLLREEEDRDFGVGAGAKGGHEVQRKSKRCPPGSHGVWEKSRQGRTEPLWSNFLMEENEGYY